MLKKLTFLLFTFFQFNVNSAVYDCFTFLNEFELLELRIEELKDVVDYFVLVEGKKNFMGEEKPLFFAENSQLFEKYLDKIIHVVIEDFPEDTGDAKHNYWNREIYSRNYILKGLEQCKNDDIIFISDVDEIPSSNAVKKIKDYFKKTGVNPTNKIKQDDLICALNMRLFVYYLNLESPNGWNGAVKAVPYWLLRKISPWDLKLLHNINGNLKRIKNAGWHFSSMGSYENYLYKLRCAKIGYEVPEHIFDIVNQEENLEAYIKKLCNIYSTRVVPIDSSYPQHILNNLEFFHALGWIANSNNTP